VLQEEGGYDKSPYCAREDQAGSSYNPALPKGGLKVQKFDWKLTPHRKKKAIKKILLR